MKYFKEIFKNKLALDEEQKEILDEITIVEAEKVLEELKAEEDEARAKLRKNLKDIFNDLPILLF